MGFMYARKPKTEKPYISLAAMAKSPCSHHEMKTADHDR
jgi:hypothetical protein